MGSHVGSKSISCRARVVAVCANKGLLSAVNSHVDFQLGRCVTSIAALVAIVTFLSIRLKIVDIEFSGHVEYFKFWSLYSICVAGSYLITDGLDWMTN